MKEQREIVLPPHLYDRIRASAGEHGGVGGGGLFTHDNFPLCAHGHAWGTCTRYARERVDDRQMEEPELAQHLTWIDNDVALEEFVGDWQKVVQEERIPFAQWCELLNVKRGVEVAKEVIVEREAVTV